jgi:hypothetical protein
MTHSTATAEKDTESIADHERADTVSDAFLVGVDAQGREHYHSRIRNAVTVLDGDEHVHTESLDGRVLSEWMAFIEQECGGWTENNTYSGSTIDQLCNQLASGLNGGGD